MIKIFNKITIYYLIIGLLLILDLLAFINFPFEKVILQIVPPALAALIVGLVFDFLETKKWQLSFSTLITGLIIGAVAQYGEETWKLILIAVLAMTAKFFLKLDGRHIFNPAASGLFLGMIFLSSYPSWWAGTLNPWVFYLWIPIILLKQKRWAPMLAFFAPVALIEGVSLDGSAALLFFSSVMLIEPKTSPARVKVGLIYGLIVAASYLTLGRFLSWDPLITALLLGNLSFRLIDKYSS